MDLFLVYDHRLNDITMVTHTNTDGNGLFRFLKFMFKEETLFVIYNYHFRQCDNFT